MKKTDYSKIAPKYDDNKIRHSVEKDQNIAELIARGDGGSFTVLDLACGTGNYLVRQTEEYKDLNIKWIGIDKSPDMLEVARQKNLDAELMVGDACDIPLEDESVDYIKIRFAFHHFDDKIKALKEVRRVLKPEGSVSIYNINNDYMRHYWVYKYYPQIEKLDGERFPKSIDIFKWLDDLHFETQAAVHTFIKKFYYADILDEVRNRDMSQLHLISDEEYQDGMDRIIADSKDKEYLVGDVSFVDFLGKKLS